MLLRALKYIAGGFKIAGSRPIDLDVVLEKCTTEVNWTTAQREAVKEAIEGPLKDHWNGEGNGDIPDEIIFKELHHVLPELFVRENLEKRQISERGCLSLLNDKKLLKERGLAAEKAQEKADKEQRKIAKVQRAAEIQKEKEDRAARVILAKLEKEKKEALLKAKEDALTPEARQKKLQAAQKRADTKAQKALKNKAGVQES